MWYKKRKGPKSGRAKAIERADLWFSRYVRLRDASGSYFICCSCQQAKLIEKADCGHYISRSNEAIRWFEKNASAQCSQCNRFKGGEKDLHRDHLIKKWGPGVLDEIDQEMARNKFKKFDEYELREIAKHFRKKHNDLKKQKQSWSTARPYREELERNK